jgi:hypothetical protein
MRLSGCAVMPTPTSPLGRLGGFRTELHARFTRRADALVDLADALLCAPAVPSVAHLSLEPAYRRGWGSAYDAPTSGRVDTERLRDLLVSSLPDADPLVFAVDVTTRPRCDAECSPERGYYYHPSRHSAGQPIIAGWAYQWICRLSFDRDSWTAPVDACRLHPLDDTDHQAARQIRALVERLPAGRAVPLVVFDGGYDSAQLTLDLGGAPVAVLVRLRSDRCLLRRPATATTGQDRPATPPRRQVQLRRPGHLAGPDRRPCPSGPPVRHRDRAGLGGAASQAAAPSRPRHRWAAADRARHRHLRPGRTGPRSHAAAEGAVAVVGRPRGPRVRSGPGVAGLHPRVRPGAHRSVL